MTININNEYLLARYKDLQSELQLADCFMVKLENYIFFVNLKNIHNEKIDSVLNKDLKNASEQIDVSLKILFFDLCDISELKNMNYRLNKLKIKSQEFVQYVIITEDAITTLEADLKLMIADNIVSKDELNLKTQSYHDVLKEHKIILSKIEELKNLSNKIDKLYSVVNSIINKQVNRNIILGNFIQEQSNLRIILNEAIKWQLTKKIIIKCNVCILISILILSLMCSLNFTNQILLQFSNITFIFTLFLSFFEHFLVPAKAIRIEKVKYKNRTSFKRQTQVSNILILISFSLVFLLNTSKAPEGFLFILIISIVIMFIEFYIYKKASLESDYYTNIKAMVETHELFENERYLIEINNCIESKSKDEKINIINEFIVNYQK